MEKCDVLLTYEIKNREIENLCLIKRELERRGYNVKMCMQYDTYFNVPEPIEAKVIVIPAYYRDRARFYTSSHLVSTKKIVNMRWEQVVSNAVNAKADSLYAIKEWGQGAVHISWGQDSFNTMVKEWGVPEDHVKICGHVTLDYMRRDLVKYYYSREELFKKYRLPANEKVHLFISSFSLSGMHKRVIKHTHTKKYSYLTEQYNKAAAASQKEILKWFEDILNETADDVIVYRPHPEEKNNALLLDLQKKQPDRFFVIGDETIKQWILACDRLYTWASTSIAEVFASGKGCAVLRPVEVPRDNEMTIYNNASTIKTYADFKKEFLADGKQSFPIEESIIRSYYDIDENKYSFERVCDVIEDVLRNDKYTLDQPLSNPFGKSPFNKYKVENFIKRKLAKSKAMEKVYKKDMFPNSKFRENLDDVFYVKNKLKNNHVTDEEIDAIVARIDKALG